MSIPVKKADWPFLNHMLLVTVFRKKKDVPIGELMSGGHPCDQRREKRGICKAGKNKETNKPQELSHSTPYSLPSLTDMSRIPS